jgi:hypothetical protein
MPRQRPRLCVSARSSAVIATGYLPSWSKSLSESARGTCPERGCYISKGRWVPVLRSTQTTSRQPRRGRSNPDRKIAREPNRRVNALGPDSGFSSQAGCNDSCNRLENFPNNPGAPVRPPKRDQPKLLQSPPCQAKALRN